MELTTWLGRYLMERDGGEGDSPGQFDGWLSRFGRRSSSQVSLVCDGWKQWVIYPLVNARGEGEEDKGDS